MKIGRQGVSKVFLVDLEAVDTRYTGEWKIHFPDLLRNNNIEVVVIDGPTDIPAATTPGAFLNFGGTNVYKAAQVEKFSRMFCSGDVKDGDYFLFTDAWHPGIINLKYMASLLNIKIKIGALWHAGSYDPADFLGRIIGDAPWVRHTEQAYFQAIDHNFFATNFHIRLFAKTMCPSQYRHEWRKPTREEAWLSDMVSGGKIIQTGWPMEYMSDILAPYKNMKKRELILFPHRIAPEKQVDIFRDIASVLPQYEFIVCQDKQLTKQEYHTLLGEAKIVFSASLQETLGIGCYEGALVGALPMVPDRLSYTEMYYEGFKYPSNFTLDLDHYSSNRQQLCSNIISAMTFYEQRLPQLHKQAADLIANFFSCTNIINTIKSAK